MPSIGFLAQKGGAGKTTLAVHLAVLAGDALLVDLDPQRSTAEWWESRQFELPELAVGEPSDLATALAASPRAWKLVDTAPHAAEAARIVAAAVDLAVIPTRPGILDLRAIRATVEIVRAAGARAVIVLNACPPARGAAEASVTAEARQVLTTYQLTVAPVAIIQRAALSHALNDGRAVTEFEPDGKAAEELRNLWRWISEQTSPAAPRGAGRARRSS
jgi:chromosome partitioning protein